MNKLWTAEQERALKKLYPAYLSGELSRTDLEHVFLRGHESILRKAQRLGLSVKKPESGGVDYKYLKQIGYDLKI